MEQRYISYNDKVDVASLDVNTVKDSTIWVPGHTTGIHGIRLYEPGECGSTDYSMFTDKMEHPDHSSRFGYNSCANGYCSGHWPGRYNEPCGTADEQPKDMAPCRFYQPEYTNPYNVNSQAIVDYNNFR